MLFAILLLAATSQEPDQAAQLTGLRTRLRTVALERMTEHQVPGIAISVIRDGKVVLFEGIGFADRQSGTPVTEDTVFNIASISKTVAAWGFLRLVQEKKLTLDDPVLARIERFKLPRSKYDDRGVTLRRILSHTAGLSVGGIEGFDPGRPLPSLEEVMKGGTASCGKLRLQHEPGERYQYSGGGYMLAQLLAEELTERDFAEWMNEEVLTPLGMTRSGFGWRADLLAAAATPHDRRGKPIAGHRFAATATAGFQTTAADLARFAIASMPDYRPKTAESVLSREWLERMLHSETKAGNAGAWGLGTILPAFGAGGVFGHTGGYHGWIASLWFQPELGEGLVILSNGTNADKFLDRIESVWVQDMSARGMPWKRVPAWNR